MSIEILFEGSSSSLAIRLAALILVSGHNNLMLAMAADLRKEIEILLKWLEALPENLGKVLAWEALAK